MENIVDGDLHIRYNGATEIEWAKLDKGEDTKGWLPALEEIDLDESVDLRDIKKKNYNDTLLKYTVPAGVILLALERIITAIIN